MALISPSTVTRSIFSSLSQKIEDDEAHLSLAELAETADCLLIKDEQTSA